MNKRLALIAAVIGLSGIARVDQLSVTGTDNKVSYRKGISGPKPKISSTGQNNKIAQAK